MLTHLLKKILMSSLFIMIITSCKQRPNDAINAAAVKVSGAFITERAHSSLNLRIKGGRSVRKEGDSTFYVTGTVEGFSSYNVPFSVEHFSEIVRYSGGDINNPKNWVCLEIYVGKKRIK